MKFLPPLFIEQIFTDYILCARLDIRTVGDTKYSKVFIYKPEIKAISSTKNRLVEADFDCRGEIRNKEKVFIIKV